MPTVEEAAKATEVQDFLIDIFEVSSPTATQGDMMFLIGSLYRQLGL